MNLQFIQWNAPEEIFSIFGISVRYYGVLFVGGLILCLQMLAIIWKREKFDIQNLNKLSLYSLIGIIVGARLGHCLFYDPAYYFSHPIEMIFPVQALPTGGYKFTGYQGLASHGGTLGIIIAVLIYVKKTKESFLQTLDYLAIAAPLGSFFIRLANLMNSEIIGIPTNVPWAFIFTKEDSIPRHPAQLYEAMCYIIFFIIIWVLYTSKKFKNTKGFFLGLSITLIFTARFFIEFLKEKQVAFEEQMKLDMGQLLSIPFIIIGIGCIVYALKHKKEEFEA